MPFLGYRNSKEVSKTGAKEGKNTSTFIVVFTKFTTKEMYTMPTILPLVAIVSKAIKLLILLVDAHQLLKDMAVLSAKSINCMHCIRRSGVLVLCKPQQGAYNAYNPKLTEGSVCQ
jgi:hypothetical protein